MSQTVPNRSRFEFIETVDQALDRCVNIRTLARLLEACDSGASAAGLESEVVSNTGWLIKEEAARLRELVLRLQHLELANPRRRC